MEMKPKIIITDALHTFFFSLFPSIVAHVGFQLYPTPTWLGLKSFVVAAAGLLLLHQKQSGRASWRQSWVLSPTCLLPCPPFVPQDSLYCVENLLLFFAQSSKIGCFVDILCKYKTFATTACQTKKKSNDFVEQFPTPLLHHQKKKNNNNSPAPPLKQHIQTLA